MLYLRGRRNQNENLESGILFCQNAFRQMMNTKLIAFLHNSSKIIAVLFLVALLDMQKRKKSHTHTYIQNKTKIASLITKV